MSLFGLSESVHNTNQRHQEQRHKRHKWLKHRAQNLSSRTIFFVLIILFTLPSIVSYAIAPASVEKDATWWSGFLQNFGTEMAGAIATFFLFELITGSQTDKRNLFRLVRGEDKQIRDNALRELSDEDGLRGADLSEVNLSHTKLISCDLSGANLRHANLRHANLFGANISGADLSHADLSFAQLIMADLSHTNLTGTNLLEAELLLAKVQGAEVTFPEYSSDKIRDAVKVMLSGLGVPERNDETILPDGTQYDPERGLEQLERFTHPPETDDTTQPEQPPD